MLGTGCTFSVNSKCYALGSSTQQTWYSASRDCVYYGSLAVFADMDNSQLTAALNNYGTNETYWIGLVRAWWKTTDEGDTATSSSL